MALQVRLSTGGRLPNHESYERLGEASATPIPETGFDTRIAGTINRLFRDLTDPVFLGPMVLAQGIFGLSRLTLLKLANPGTPKAAALFSANLGAFALEGLGYVGSTRGLRQAMGGAFDPAISFSHELGHAYLTLGLLKTFGGLAQTGLRRRYQGVSAQAYSIQDKFILKSVPQAAQFAGIYMSHTLAPTFALGPDLDPADRALQSAVTLVHFGMAGHVLARIPGYAGSQQRVAEFTGRWIYKTWTEGPFKNFDIFPRGVELASVPYGGLANPMIQNRWDPKQEGLLFSKDIPDRKRGPGRFTPISALRPTDPTMVMTVQGLAFRIKADGTIVDVQGKQPKSFLVQKDHYIGARVQDLPFPHDIRKKLELVLAKTLESGEIQSVEFNIPLPEGPSYREILLVPLGPDEVVATFRDTTPLKTKEAQREALLSIMNASSDLVTMVTPEGKIFYANRAALEKLGLTTAEQMERRINVTENFPPWAVHQLQNVGIPTALREGLWVGETALVDSQGKEIPFLQRIIAHRDSEGKLTHFSSILTDISQLKKMQEVRISEERLEALKLVVPGLVHDINNLLGAVRLRMGTWQKNLGGIDETVRVVEQVGESPVLLEKLRSATAFLRAEFQDTDSSVSRVSYLLRSLKELDTEPKKGPPFALMEILDTDVLREVLPPQQPIQVLSDVERAMVPGPKEEVLRALHNIVKNAGEAVEGRAHTLITIRSEKVYLSELELSQLYLPWRERDLSPGTFLKISIEDQGRGMDERTRSRVFDPYYSTKNSRSSDPPGGSRNIRGLGMAITRKVIHDAGGFILVESFPDRGTRFDVYLPEVARESNVFNPSRYAETVRMPIIFISGGGKIQEDLPGLLKKQGFKTVLTADSFEEARAIVKQYPMGAAVFVDNTRGGFDAAAWQALRSEHPQLIVMPMTIGQGNESGTLQFYSDKGQVRTSTPLSSDGLAFIVANLLEKNRP